MCVNNHKQIWLIGSVEVVHRVFPCNAEIRYERKYHKAILIFEDFNW